MKASTCDLRVVSDVVQPGGVGYDGSPSSVQQMAYAVGLTSDARRMGEARADVVQQPIGKASCVGPQAARVGGVKIDWTEQT
jgi:hypothetical protein